MNSEVQAIIDNTDYNGYVVVSQSGIYGKTVCPNKATALALDLSGQVGEKAAATVKVYSVGTMGEYHHTPGERVGEEFDWNRYVRELMD